MANYLSDRTGANIDAQLDKADTLLTPANGETLYSTGNTGVINFDDGTAGLSGSNEFRFFETLGGAYIARAGTGLNTLLEFWNNNGITGSIKNMGTTTEYNVSSDPRLKAFKDLPSDTDVNEEFNKLFSCFRVFNWKADLTGPLVWGFDAHACIDSGLDIGSEGEGPRDLLIGDIYETTPVVKHVSPAGVDQSKAVPILLAKLEQLERRLTAAGL